MPLRSAPPGVRPVSPAFLCRGQVLVGAGTGHLAFCQITVQENHEEWIGSNREVGSGGNGNSRAPDKNLGNRGRHFLCPKAIMAEQDWPHEAKYQAEG